MTLAPDRPAVEAEVKRLFAVSLEGLEVPRVLHVVACVERDGWLHPLRIGPHSPPSPHDRFVLDLARALSGTIVTTGAILRAEPDLRYRLPPGLRAVRGERPLRPAILTSARDLPYHPLWDEAGNEPLVVTDAEGAQRVGDFAPVCVVDGGIRGAIDALDGPVVLEAGPSTVAPLYPSKGIDGLWLSRFEGEVAPEHLAGRLVEVAEVEEAMVRRSDTRIEEASGPWRFSRYQRA